MTDKLNTRELALDMLIEIIEEGKFSHTLLSHTLKKHQSLEKQDRAFITRLCIGSVKHYITLDYIIDQFASLPVRRMKPLIRNLLRLSVYQICYMEQVPVSAVCNEAVTLAKKRKFTNLSGFVNGVLRNIARNKDILSFPDKDRNKVKYLEITTSTPAWLVEELLDQYGSEKTNTILMASLREKETTIRCNRSKIAPDELKRLLEEEGVIAEANDYLDYAFRIRNYDYLEKLKTFREGFFAVQDVSSMLVSHIAGIRKEDFVVDVCAAPGGKALHASEYAGKVSARDLTKYKVELISENIDRLGCTNVETKVWDAAQLDSSIIGKADVVIADLPCSGMGIFGKKPDIKYKLSKNRLKELVQLQRDILTVARQYVRVGGVLIYSTCTINREENLDNRDWFLQQGDFEAQDLDPYLPEALRDGTTGRGYLQLLQGIHDTDGFFISKYRRIR